MLLQAGIEPATSDFEPDIITIRLQERLSVAGIEPATLASKASIVTTRLHEHLRAQTFIHQILLATHLTLFMVLPQSSQSS